MELIELNELYMWKNEKIDVLRHKSGRAHFLHPITTFAQSSQHSLMHRGHSASLNATRMHLDQVVGYYSRSRGRSRPSRFPPLQTAASGGGEGPAECPGCLRLCRGAGSLPSGQVCLRPDRHVANEVVVIHAVVHVVQAGWPEEISLLRVDVES